MLGGVATWFDAPEGTAAAGPILRDALGADWRGSTVVVCLDNGSVSGSLSKCVAVSLDDWCACGPRNGKDTLLDLSRTDFARLAPLSRGVIDVTVEWGGPAVTPPATDMAGYWTWPGGGPR